MVAFPGWVKTALPIAGLGLLPVVGLTYAELSSTAPRESDAPHAGASGAPARAGEPAEARRVSRAPEAPRAAPPAVAAANDRAAFAAPETAAGREAAKHLCCEKLTELAQASEVRVRATYQAAGAACNASSTNDEAYQQVASIIQGTSAAVPSECKKR